MHRVLHFALACCLTAVQAQDVAAPAPQIREVSPGNFEIGRLRLNREARSITLPATVNKAAADDILEYLLVTRDGPTHESLLLTEVQPTDLHFAMLLLGAKGAGDQGLSAEQLGGGQITADFLKNAPKLRGDAIRIAVKWKAADGKERAAPVEDWLFNLEKKQAMPRGPWLYTGSSFLEGRFRAQHEGCFGALVSYPPALINNPRPGNDRDDIWAVNAKLVPPVDTPVELIIVLENPAPDAPAK